MFLHPSVLAFLDQICIDGLVIRIPADASDHLVRAVHPIFRLYGGVPQGKRVTGDACYVFRSDPEPIIALIRETRMANLLNFWPCPPWLADHMIRALNLASLPEGALVVEPSCGTGALLDPLVRALVRLNRSDVQIIGVEIAATFASRLTARYHAQRPAPAPEIVHANFLDWRAPRPVSAFLSNPPYSAVRPSYQPFVYAEHLLHMADQLAQGGIALGLVPTTWRERPAERWPGLGRLQARIETSGTYQALPPGVFQDQGSGVRCDLIALGRGERPVLPPLPNGMQEDAGPAEGLERVTLYVGNLPQYLADDALARLFQPYGTVLGARCPSDRVTGRLRGFGFVDLDCADVDGAIAATNGLVLGSSVLLVRRAEQARTPAG